MAVDTTAVTAGTDVESQELADLLKEAGNETEGALEGAAPKAKGRGKKAAAADGEAAPEKPKRKPAPEGYETPVQFAHRHEIPMPQIVYQMIRVSKMPHYRDEETGKIFLKSEEADQWLVDREQRLKERKDNARTKAQEKGTGTKSLVRMAERLVAAGHTEAASKVKEALSLVEEDNSAANEIEDDAADDEDK
jgi:hypothetical protein